MFHAGVSGASKVSGTLFCGFFVNLIRTPLTTRLWKDYDFYITSVYCIDESKYQGSVTNEKIESFNSSMSWYKNFIDIYDISKREIISSDGLHFSAKCYQKLYQEILNRLGD